MSEDKQKTILVAEDEFDLNSALCTALIEAGYKTVPAYNGKDTVDIFLKEKPDFILLDINMPIMSGIEVLEKIRGYEEGKTVPVSIFTNRGSMDFVSDAVAVGGMNTDFFTKSEFSLDQIVERVKARLS
ncbi:response regulator [Candidatus Kaiserbacteria bacterium]|nr:response regulator [Candidatus Kaiserbacteria bacterium]